MRPSLNELAARLGSLDCARRRTIVGIAGAPGAGKSTLAARLAARTGAVVVPMDGFHLSNAELRATGRLERKGAPDTFNALGYVALLRRLREDSAAVLAPAFDRDLDEPVAAAITVAPGALVLTEGNYLLLDTGPWAAVRPMLDEAWFVTVEPDERVRRLVARHVRFGRDEVSARRRATLGSDADNAALVAASEPRADLLIHT